jgi:hypothetical protein
MSAVPEGCCIFSDSIACESHPLWLQALTPDSALGANVGRQRFDDVKMTRYCLTTANSHWETLRAIHQEMKDPRLAEALQDGRGMVA